MPVDSDYPCSTTDSDFEDSSCQCRLPEGRGRRRDGAISFESLRLHWKVTVQLQGNVQLEVQVKQVTLAHTKAMARAAAASGLSVVKFNIKLKLPPALPVPVAAAITASASASGTLTASVCHWHWQWQSAAGSAHWQAPNRCQWQPELPADSHFSRTGTGRFKLKPEPELRPRWVGRSDAESGRACQCWPLAA